MILRRSSTFLSHAALSGQAANHRSVINVHRLCSRTTCSYPRRPASRRSTICMPASTSSGAATFTSMPSYMLHSGRQYTRPGFSRSKELNVPPMLSTHWQRVAPRGRRSFSSSGPSPTEAGQLPTIASSRSCPFSSSTLEPVFLLEIRVQREDILVERLVRLDVYPVSLPCLSLLRGAKSVPYYS